MGTRRGPALRVKRGGHYTGRKETDFEAQFGIRKGKGGGEDWKKRWKMREGGMLRERAGFLQGSGGKKGRNSGKGQNTGRGRNGAKSKKGWSKKCVHDYREGVSGGGN